MDLDLPPDHAGRAMLAIAGCVGLAAAFAPDTLQRLFGIPTSALTGGGRMGWRLFGARNLYLTARAVTGHADGLAAFGPLQLLDQLVFWQAFVTRSVPRRTSVAAAAASAILIGLDAHRRLHARESWHGRTA